MSVARIEYYYLYKALIKLKNIILTFRPTKSDFILLYIVTKFFICKSIIKDSPSILI